MLCKIVQKLIGNGGTIDNCTCTFIQLYYRLCISNNVTQNQILRM
jgi:hypothetical protein